MCNKIKLIKTIIGKLICTLLLLSCFSLVFADPTMNNLCTQETVTAENSKVQPNCQPTDVTHTTNEGGKQIGFNLP